MRSGKRKAPQSKNDREAEYGLFITNTSTNTPNCQVGCGSVGPGAISIDAIYPVGSIYMSVNNTNPGNLFGGVWSAWGAGRVPVGVAGSGTFNSVEKTGGAETHTLTTAEIPSHNHARRNGGEFVGVNSTSGGTAFGIQNGSYYTFRWGQDVTTTSTGGGASHNNLQPYITCYMWKRVS